MSLQSFLDTQILFYDDFLSGYKVMALAGVVARQRT